MRNAVAILLILLLQPDALTAKPDNYDASTTVDTSDSTVKLLVKFKPTSDNSNNLRSFSTRSNNGGSSVNELLNNKVRSVSSISDKGHLASVDVDHQDKDMVMLELMNDDKVLLVEEDFEIHKSPAIEEQEDKQQQYTTTGHLRRSLEEVEQYGNQLIQANDILTAVSSQPNRYINTPVKVCIIDTGYNIDHEDLPKDGVTQTDVGYGSAFVDNDGHGTHCAGVIGAIGGNEKGVAGVIPDENLFSFHIIKALNDQGIGSASVMLRAIQGCIDSGSKIISMSIGGGLDSAIFRDEYERAYNEGLLLVSASGNKGEAVHDYPASYKSVISVSAVDRYGNRAGFSNYNDQVELMAPGVSIKSTYLSGGYRSLSGTSMATPYVAGAIALVWSFFPECSNHQIRNIFARTARRKDQNSGGCDEKNGYGIIQAKAAFDALNQFGCEFGGENSIPKSSGAFGGCQQIRSLTGKTLTLAPTESPTANATDPSFTLSASTSPSSPSPSSSSTIGPTTIEPSVNTTQQAIPTDPKMYVSSARPSLNPSSSGQPSSWPSASPSTSSGPSSEPSLTPSQSAQPSLRPSAWPSASPTITMSSGPSSEPSLTPSQSTQPSSQPSSSGQPSSWPSASPSLTPSESAQPSSGPSSVPSGQPSSMPSDLPSTSSEPSSEPSLTPSESAQPSLQPSAWPSASSSTSSEPSSEPSLTPSQSAQPSSQPSLNPASSGRPSSLPSASSSTSSEPSSAPSLTPSQSAHPSFSSHVMSPIRYPVSLPSSSPSKS
eukprot:scaffold4522_cov145-Skeletonema_marinoi.AAC.7